MTDGMSIDEYLAQGGRLTTPANAPARYRAELMKIMATFVDSELAGAAGFADLINAGPGIKARIAAAKIVLEKTDNADRVLNLMGEFGADTARYATHHPWAERLPRNTPPGTRRSTHDMRLSVLNYPLQGWTDAVVMNLCMGLGVAVHLRDMRQVSYQPLAEVIRAIEPVERRHAELAEEGLARLVESDPAGVEAGFAYWTPRVAAMFGDVDEQRMAQLRRWGLRQQSGAEMREAWHTALGHARQTLGLAA